MLYLTNKTIFYNAFILEHKALYSTLHAKASDSMLHATADISKNTIFVKLLFKSDTESSWDHHQIY